jgi:hypothetical protein
LYDERFRSNERRFSLVFKIRQGHGYAVSLSVVQSLDNFSLRSFQQSCSLLFPVAPASTNMGNFQPQFFADELAKWQSHPGETGPVLNRLTLMNWRRK